MGQILLSALVALTVSITLTPMLIKLFARRGLGQEIRAEVPQHQRKRGTPTMGGIAILIGIWAGYLGSHLVGIRYDAPGVTASGLLVLGLTTALGVVGFLDDFIKLYKRRNLGLTAAGKYLGQFAAAVVFGVLALRFPDSTGVTPGSRYVSFVRDYTTVSVGVVGFLLIVLFLIAAWSNAVNITDGLDGLVAGSMSFALGAYVIITFWQYTNACATTPETGCYDVRDPLDLAVVCAAGVGACLGFLWWNAAPAKIIMGDTGSLALGGLLAGLSITTRTELLMVVVGALYCAEILSVLLQIVVFRTTRNRLFKMAPFHHHFELSDWAETTITIRFWLLGGSSAAVGLMLFYGEYLAAVG
ncbi:phospho-N-acetylmuramoyl-pentapeptide-transferase [Nocardia sp. 2]|uniref:Phospho-N-acetylmuramoyl-pentapeptide-transferase n=1 Tax=Nocardia acididurans TaxID=2802282 RepID=A0ABS1MCX6_9NOCA|nr:phospho-N-acetylmuramoyl-pentapeptide-transferase [Nocardia acididurans]MBL1078498.1 phospho-N-acetylmuramoyl-pentapeptide-transferase [Nocardia acididurans]